MSGVTVFDDADGIYEGRLTAPEFKAVIRTPAPGAGGGASAGNRSFRDALFGPIPPLETSNVAQLSAQVIAAIVLGSVGGLLIGSLVRPF